MLTAENSPFTWTFLSRETQRNTSGISQAINQNGPLWASIKKQTRGLPLCHSNHGMSFFSYIQSCRTQVQTEWSGGFENVVSAKDVCNHTGQTSPLKKVHGGAASRKGANTAAPHEWSGFTGQAGADALPEVFCARSSLLPLSRQEASSCQENADCKTINLLWTATNVPWSAWQKQSWGHRKKEQPFYQTANSSMWVATKCIDFTSPLSDQEAHLVPPTPVFTKSSSRLLTGHAGILPFSPGETDLLNFSETKWHKAMLLHLAHSPTRDLGKGEGLVTGRADTKGASLYLLPL